MNGVCGGVSAGGVLLRKKRNEAKFDEQGYDVNSTMLHTILYRINQKIDFSFVNEACSDLYSPDKGRPVINTPERSKGKIWENIGLKFSELCKIQQNIFLKTKI